MCIRDSKYSAPGGRITVKLWAGEYKAFVEIMDQGRGIPPEDLENVKTKFYKGSNSVRGSGIGPVSYTHLDPPRRSSAGLSRSLHRQRQEGQHPLLPHQGR